MTYSSVSPDRLVQQDLFRAPPSRPPLVVADGMGVDSTALLIVLNREGRRPDLILFADTGNERDETYAYKQVRQAWLEKVGFPPLITVRYQPKDYKNWPPYHTLGENCLTNGTLPSLAFGFKSCSLKWKVAPQNAYVDRWAPAREARRAAIRVQNLIGYDASPKDRRRYAHAQGLEDPKYEYFYPLIEWGWDRERCTEEIRND